MNEQKDKLEGKTATVRTGAAGVKVDIARPPRKKDTQKGQMRQG